MDGTILPRVHAMVLCDGIELSLTEEKVFNLLGVRSALEAATFPYVPPELWAYLQVTGHPGTADGELVVVNGGTDQEVFRQVIPQVRFEGPLAVIPVRVLLEGCEFPEPAVYYVQVYFGPKLVCERVLHITESAGTGNGQAVS